MLAQLSTAPVLLQNSAAQRKSVHCKRTRRSNPGVPQVLNGLRALAEMERYATLDEALGSDKRLKETVSSKMATFREIDSFLCYIEITVFAAEEVMGLTQHTFYSRKRVGCRKVHPLEVVFLNIFEYFFRLNSGYRGARGACGACSMP